MEAGKYRAFQVRLNKDKARGKDAEPTNPRARVSLLASHERLREKRLCLAGVQAIKSRFFPPIYRKYLYILSYPVFLYYAESPKVPPRVFGPLGPKTLRGQKVSNFSTAKKSRFGQTRRARWSRVIFQQVRKVLSGRCHFATTRSSSSALRSCEREVAFPCLLPAFRVLSSSVLRFATASLHFAII